MCRAVKLAALRSNFSKANSQDGSSPGATLFAPGFFKGLPMENTSIEYCHHSFSPWRGCVEVDAGCTNCYAKSMAQRNPVVLGGWGYKGPRVVPARKAWREMRTLNNRARRNNVIETVLCHWCDPWEDWPGVMVDHEGNTLKWCNLCKQVFFHGSKVCDHKHDHVPATMHHVRIEYFRLIDECQNLTFLLTTKRPNQIRRMWPGPTRSNVALGVSVSSTDDAIEKVAAMHDVFDLAGVTWVSAEPLLNDLDLIESRIASSIVCTGCGHRRLLNQRMDACQNCGGESCDLDYCGFDWIVVGGESGRKARPCHTSWIERVIYQAQASLLPVFVKQLGANPVLQMPHNIGDRKGSDPEEWPSHLRVREYPDFTERPEGLE